MARRKPLILAASVVGIAVLIGLGQMAYRLSPKTVPDNQEGLKKASLAILEEKCLACHSNAQELPFYAAIPGIGAMVKNDSHTAKRHWDLADISNQGETASFDPSNPQITLPMLNKLNKVINDNTMPVPQYVMVHWGTNLSGSEKEILNKWIAGERARLLDKWGVKEYAHSFVQPLPDALPTDPVKVALGELLYHDKRLSKDNTISCASCHALDKGGTDNQSFSPGVGGQLGGVNAPTSFNAVFNINQFWDGRAADLQAQAGGPPLNPVEMASASWEEVIEKLKQDPVLTEKFLAVYPDGYSGENICNAIAEYEKTLITPNSRFDKFLKGDKNALTPDEQKGYQLFLANNCATCHAGPSMGGQSFEYLDLKDDFFAGRQTNDGDKGLAAFSKQDKDLKRFKVPTLRNVALTAPYFHNASQATLEDAVRSMMKYQVGKPATDEEIKLMCDFLRTLTGELNGKPLEQTAAK